jgi:DNA-binding transcriptional ArsR family regulator
LRRHSSNILAFFNSRPILPGMPAHHDASEFVDSDFQSARQSAFTAPLPGPAAGAAPPANRPPTREEIEALLGEKQIELAKLTRQMEEKEREKSGWEELRRRQMEFQTGRAEMLQHLARGVGLLEEAELKSRREADQMARALEEFRAAVSKLQAINEQTWSQENFAMELTRALTTIENARMEWNAGRLKFPLLAGAAQSAAQSAPREQPASLATLGFGGLFKIGLALTLPVWLAGLAIFIALCLRR